MMAGLTPHSVTKILLLMGGSQLNLDGRLVIR